MPRIKVPECMHGSGYIVWGGAAGLAAMLSIYTILNSI